MAGANGVVVYTVVFNLATVSLSVFEGISQTIQPMISNYYGEKSFTNVRYTMRLALISIAIICGAVTVGLEIYPEVIPAIFGLDEAALISASAVAVRIFATSMIIMTVNVVIGYYLQSVEYNFMAAVIISLRCFVLFMAATLILGSLFGMNGIWAAYTVAEGCTFLIIVIMIKWKQKKKAQAGRKVNFLLLDQEIERGIICETYDCDKNDLAEYVSNVNKILLMQEQLEKSLCKDTIQYLSVLKTCEVGAGKLVEVEINSMEQKVIIRDNLNHGNREKQLQDAVSNGSIADYGPVLGWNRMCIGKVRL